MTIIEALQEYADKKTTAIKLIRSMTGTVRAEMAIDVLALVNQITRIEEGDLDMETFKEMYGLT